MMLNELKKLYKEVKFNFSKLKSQVQSKFNKTLDQILLDLDCTEEELKYTLYISKYDVKSINPVTKSVEIKPIKVCSKTQKPDFLFNIILDDFKHTSLKVTENHKLMKDDFTFVEAKDLKSGDFLKTETGSVRIKSIEIISHKDWVYNLAVADNETYFIHTESDNIASHNCKMVTFACISKDTLISLENNQEIKISDLLNKNYTQYKVRSFSSLPEGITYSKIQNVQRTKFCKTLYRVIFTNGYYIECTPDHHFLNQDYQYQEAQNLKIGDRLLGEGTDLLKSDHYESYKLTQSEYEYTQSHTQKVVVPVFDKSKLSYLEVLNIVEVDYNDWVYDLSVESTFNYGVKLRSSDSRLNQNQDIRLFVGNTLYGASPQQMGVKFFNGDVDRATELYKNFMDGFPNVKKFINFCHEFGLLNGKIQIPFLGDYIRLSDLPYEWTKLPKEVKEKYASHLEKLMGRDGDHLSEDFQTDRRIKGNISKALRVSQNAPIQELASVLAGNQIYELIQEFDNTSLRVESFQHDSFTGELLIPDLPWILKNWKKVMVGRIRNRFDIPVDMDLEIGIAGYKMMELKCCEVSDDLKTVTLEHKKGCCKVKATIWKEIKEQLLRNGVKILKEEVVKSGKNLVSQDDLYITKIAYSSEIGKTYEELKLNLVLDFTDVHPNIYSNEIKDI